MRIYVGNLPFSTTEEEMQAIFAEFGEVTSSAIITDRETGRPRGFGFIEMSDDEAGRKAIDEVNGREVDGRSLKVNEARPREDRSGGGGGRRGGGGGGGW